MINNSIIFQYQFFNISLSLCNYLNFSLVMQLYFFTSIQFEQITSHHVCYEPALKIDSTPQSPNNISKKV